MIPEKGKVYLIKFRSKNPESNYEGLAKCTASEPMAKEGTKDLWLFDLLDERTEQEWAFFAESDIKKVERSR